MIYKRGFFLSFQIISKQELLKERKINLKHKKKKKKKSRKEKRKKKKK